MNKLTDGMVAEEDAGAMDMVRAPEDIRHDKATTQEEQLVLACAHRLDQVAQWHPDWFVYFDDVQALSASRADVVELLRCAPNEYTRGLMYGIYLMRSEISIITGRDFK